MKHALFPLAAALTLTSLAFAQPAPQSEAATDWVPREGFLLKDVAGFRRGGIDHYDPLEALMVRHGLDALRPADGEAIDLEDGQERHWQRVTFDERGALEQGQMGRGSCVYVPIEMERDGVMVLHGSSHGGIYVNGIPHTPNVYGYSYYHIPVQLRAGHNGIMLRGGRQGVQLRLYEPPASTFLLPEDTTLPDAIVGQGTDAWGAVIVVNAAPQEAGERTIVCRDRDGATTETPLPVIPPLSIRKVGFRIRTGQVTDGETPLTLDVELRRGHGQADHSLPLELRRRSGDEAHKRTFLSQLDGSVQYFGLRPAIPLTPDDPAPALVLSCHGASVEGIGQAAAYSPKSWLHLVAPTNRRPYGFDWEDLGRADALEVLELAQRELRHDPARIYLTGHSMGGHGTWHIGSLFPDRFAAIGPSAGWISYSSYGRRNADENVPQSSLQALLERGRIIGDPSQFVDNLAQQGVYILHGGDDDNVPASQARRMSELLDQEHHDWYYHEEPGKSHWWSNDLDDGGATCMDWPDMYDAFARHALPPRQSVRTVKFVTANPGVSHVCHWLSIEAQLKHQALSRVNIGCWPNKRRFQGTTDNVALLALDLRHLTSRGPITIEFDGQTLEQVDFPENEDQVWLRRSEGQWQLAQRPPRSHKGPHRYGAMKNELRRQFVFVYGTGGDAEENAWTFAKARLDAETLWYRGNGSVDVLADATFDPQAYADRTILLYGNADTNKAWPALLEQSPVQVRTGSMQLDGDELQGDDLACLFVRPRPDSDVASVIAITATGVPGLRLACQQSLFQPFVRYPDCLVLRAPPAGTSRATIERAGYFGLDWSVAAGEFLAREP